MNIDIRRLKSNVDSFIEVDEDVKIDKKLLEENNIIDIKDMKVTGTISNDYEEYYLNLSIKGTLVLPCSITLNPTDYPIDVKIEGNSQELYEEIKEFCQNDENTLDIFPIIWENILMEIPIRVVSNGAELKDGGNYKVITDDTPSSSPFDKLNELL